MNIFNAHLIPESQSLFNNCKSQETLHYTAKYMIGSYQHARDRSTAPHHAKGQTALAGQLAAQLCNNEYLQVHKHLWMFMTQVEIQCIKYCFSLFSTLIKFE